MSQSTVREKGMIMMTANLSSCLRHAPKQSYMPCEGTGLGVFLQLSASETTIKTLPYSQYVDELQDLVRFTK